MYIILKDKQKKYSAYKLKLRRLYFGLNYNNWIHLFSHPLLGGDWQMIWTRAKLKSFYMFYILEFLFVQYVILHYSNIAYFINHFLLQQRSATFKVKVSLCNYSTAFLTQMRSSLLILIYRHKVTELIRKVATKNV